MKQDKNKPKKSKKSTNKIYQLLQDKKDKLDWENFNLLENLLIFCTIPEKIAPKESGVHFRITVDSQDKSLCILFKPDRGTNDPLIRGEKIKRPDYMSLYINDKLCICTIIEMKGTNHNSNETGLEQILTLRDILKDEISTHLTTKLKIKFQGILLTPYNSQTPDRKILELAKNDFIIKPIQYHSQAELYPYISKLNTIKDLKARYVHQEIDKSNSPLCIEEILTRKALPKRINPVSYSEAPDDGKKEGIYIEYLLSDDGDYVTLFSDRNLMLIHIKGNELNKEAYQKKIEEELNILNLIERLRIKFK